MVKTRLGTKFKNWTFVLKSEGYTACLIAFAEHCEHISYKKIVRRRVDKKLKVFISLKEEQSYDDVYDAVSWFACDVYPCVEYTPASPIPAREEVFEVIGPVRDEDREDGEAPVVESEATGDGFRELFAIWFVVLVGAVAMMVSDC